MMQTLSRQRTERDNLGSVPGCRLDLLGLHCLILRDNLDMYFEFIANISKFFI